MILKIRLKRVGSKHKPFYFIVLAKNLSKRNSSIIKLGFYNPQTKNLNYNKSLFFKYINCGAQPTSTLRHLIIKNLNNKE
jgi:small subunit ribosomal protein S16